MDTEANVTPTASGERQTWRLGVTCHDHQGSERGQWRAPDWAVHDTPRDLWEWVDARAVKAGRTVILAHNLGYDLRIADAFRILPTLGWRIDRLRPEGRSVQARWRRGKQTLAMIDTQSWWPCALSAVAADVGAEKMPLPAWDGARGEWEQRCVRDVLIMQTAWRETLAFLWREDCGSWQASGAGQAWAAWRHRFMDVPVLVSDDPDVRRLERVACWAGRAEAWRWGKLRDVGLEEWDYTTAYLSILRDCGLPGRHIGRQWRPPLQRVLDAAASMCVLVEVDVTCDVPTLPARSEHGIYWPCGTFRTVVWENELLLALEHGAQVSIVRAEFYERDRSLATFATWMHERIVANTVPTSPLERRIIKHWSRAIVGRFGVKYSTWDRYGDPLDVDATLVPMSDVVTGARTRLLMVGDDCLYESGVIEGENAVPAIMGWVMAETRVRLWEAMQHAGIENVVYVDTDGLIVTRRGGWHLARAHLPGLRRKSRYRSVDVLGPRQLVLNRELRASGIPRAAARVKARTWGAEVWSGLGSSLQHGELDSVTIARRTFVLKGVDHRRKHLPHGATAPFVAS